jgi:hypothetical protein
MSPLEFATIRLPPAVGFALLQQVVVICLSAMVLDGGMFSLICMAAFVVFWGGVGLLIARRHGSMTPLDTLIIRWAYLPLCIAIFLVAQMIWL